MGKGRWKTKLSTCEKYGKSFYLVRLAWLLRLDNPALLGTDRRELIEPEDLLIRNIVDLDWDRKQLDRYDVVKYDELTAKLLPLLKEFAAIEGEVRDYKTLSFMQLWVLAGPMLAAKLARHMLAQKHEEKQPRSSLKNLHPKRARFFDDVKEISLAFEDAIMEMGNMHAACPNSIVVVVDSESELEIVLDVENPLEVLMTLRKPLSDREIYDTACNAVRTKIDVTGAIEYANEKLSLTGISNFKSLEASLSEGRKYFRW